tara:strand:- start:45 stop:1109 length:1065 start_codon:yes stop_codon:yes gene_type:complete
MAYTTIDDPSAYFQTKIYSGTGSDLSLTFDGNSNMQPDWVWLKRRSGSGNHFAWDSVRGVNAALVPNDTDAEDTSGESINYFDSFDSNGFTVGGGGYNNTNASGSTYVGWCWKAGTSFTNSSGSNGANLDSSGSVSTTAGFSIVSFTGNRSTTRNIYHGLGAVPKMIIFKNRSSTNGWTIYNETIGNAKKLTLNNDAAAGNCTACFASTTPTSTLFTVGDDGDTNGDSENMIAYCFADVKGYSKFGSYTGNGNADGTFVYTGFKPAFVMIKSSSNSSQSWVIQDNKRDGFNYNNHRLFANSSGNEETTVRMDLLSNGFKCRDNDGNGNGFVYIFMAFAESPFVTGASAIPTTAR